MKKFLTLAAAACMIMSACASPLQTSSTTQATATTATTDNPLSGLGSLLGGGSDNGSSKSGSGLGDLLGGVVSGLLGNDKITPDRLVGTWTYVSPAVCFKSENFLQKAGGAAMATAIENKLADYYTKFRLNKVTLTVDEKQNFTLNLGLLRTSGTVTIEGEDVYFNFKALGAISLGKMKTYITMTGNQMSLMFDVTKLISIINAVGSATNSTAVKAASSLLNSYDGMCAGFKLQKQ